MRRAGPGRVLGAMLGHVCKGYRVGLAGLFRPGGVSGLADATSIGGIRFLARTTNPVPPLRRPLCTHALVALAALSAARAQASVTCTVTASGVAFGVYSTIGAASADTAGTVTVACASPITTTVSYTVMLSAGTRADPLDRTMASGTKPLPYQLFLDAARTRPWGDGSAGTSILSVSNLPIAAGLTDRRSFTIYGRIPRRQVASPGSFQDNILIILNY